MSEMPLPPQAPLVEVVRAIEASRRRIAVVVDPKGKLLGTLTDGDVRRCLLAGGTLDSPAAAAMNRRPTTAQVGSPDSLIRDRLRAANVLALPLLDEAGRFVRCLHASELPAEGRDAAAPEVAAGDARGFAAAIIMAGGEGRRLRPLTEDLPKPMVEIGGVPLIERQVRRLVQAGVGRIYISINYLGHVIRAHFGDGVDLGVEIDYLHEREKLGTGGALALLPEQPTGPILVMNGDILTTVNFGSLLQFHLDHGAKLTVAAIEHRVQIPFGVLSPRGVFVESLEEKPSQRFLCNAGVYALDPDALSFVSEPRYYNMTDLIRDCLAARQRVAIFPMHEYWSDIGTPDELERARTAFSGAVLRNE